MAKITKADPSRQRFPALSGRLIIDVYRGQLRARSWPRARGKKKTPSQQRAVDRFTSVAKLYPKIAPLLMKDAIEGAKNLPLYPRDIIATGIMRGYVDVDQIDGPLLVKHPDTIEEVMFQGFILKLADPLNHPGGTFIDLPWPLPVADTAHFWSAGEPALITIPPQVQFMSFNAGAGAPPNGDTQFQLKITDAAGAPIAYASSRQNGARSITVASGPVLVAPGQTYKVEFFLAANGTVFADGRTFFSGEILGTT